MELVTYIPLQHLLLGLISVPIWLLSHVIIEKKWGDGFEFTIEHIMLYLIAIGLGGMSLMLSIIWTAGALIGAIPIWEAIGNYYESIKSRQLFAWKNRG